MRTKANRFLSKQFARYQEGKLDESSKQIIDNWFDERMPEEPDTHLPEDNQHRELADSLFDNIQFTIRHKQARTISLWYKVAAVLIILGFTALTYRFLNTKQSAAASSGRNYMTANGQHKEVTLSDGSVIRMNAATTIRIPEAFGKDGKRNLILVKGEAFFQIKRDVKRPFIITSGAYRTTVLGTSFNIRLYPGEHRYHLAVATGKVKVEHQINKAYQLLSGGITKGKTLAFNELTNQLSTTDQGSELYFGWLSGRSEYLGKVNLVQIGAALERRYGLNVKVEDHHKVPPIYSVNINQSDIQSELRHLAIVTGLNYKLNQQSLIIKSGQ